MTRPATRVLLAGAALLAAVWALGPRQWSPPLYDGLSGPAEAYRYLNPPPGAQQTAPPSSTSKSVAISNGSSAAAFLNTEEQPPQAQFLLAENGLTVPSGAKNVTVAIKPIPPPSPVPAALGTLDGNVYEIKGTADASGAVGINKSVTLPTVVLRGPPGSSNATVVRLGAVDHQWTALRTVPLGGSTPDMVAASTDQLGDFAMVLRQNASSSSSQSSGSGTGGGGGGGGGFPVVAVVVPVVVLLVLGGVLLAVRRSRSQAAATSSKGRRRR